MLRQLRPAIMAVVVITILFGFVFPFLITGVARIAFRHQAGGSLIVRDGKVVGSELIGQSFAGPGYFHPRPSAAGSGYEAANSGATNLGPTSDKLINGSHNKLPNGKDDPGNFDGVKDLAAAYRKENRLAATTPVPADAVTRSASGLDPDISPANAYLQIPRVANARRLSEAALTRVVKSHISSRQLGCLGEPRVNVLELNIALDQLRPLGRS